MFNLLALLGGLAQAGQQQTPQLTAGDTGGSTAIPQSGADPATPVDEVTVTGQKTYPKENSVQNLQDMYANVNHQRALMQNAQGYAPHTGMFGMQGATRNLIGTLGDAMLSRWGQAPIYRPQVQREQVSDAMAGASSDPLAAADRVAATGAPGSAELANQIRQAHYTQQLHLDQQASLNQYREGNLQVRQDAENDRKWQTVTPVISGMLRSAAATKDPAKYSQAVQAATAYATARGLDISKLGLPDKLEDYNMGFGTNPGQQLRAETSTSNSIRYANTRGPASRNPTDASLAAPILQHMARDPNYQPTPNEQDILNRTNHSSTRGQRGPALTIPGLTPSSTGPARPGGPQPPQYAKFANDGHGHRIGYNTQTKRWETVSSNAVPPIH